MQMIFFDLETTDLSPLGQILNYAFVLTDENLRTIDTLEGHIELSPTQIPSPSAIKTNLVNLNDHRRGKYPTESEAMAKINKFFMKYVSKNRHPVMLIGQNISKFDVHFLRTSLIRNGYIPYYGKNLIYADTKFWANQLFIDSPRFREDLLRDFNPEEHRIFALDYMRDRLGLDDSDQTHYSMDDVLLTIELTKYFENIKSDIITYQTYEPMKYQNLGFGSLVNRLYVYKGEICQQTLFLITQDNKYSLWLDLDKFSVDEASRDSVIWFKKDFCTFSLSKDEPLVSQGDLSTDRKEKFQAICHYMIEEIPSWSTVGGFFEDPKCDIEQHIYKLRFDQLKSFCQALHKGDIKSIVRLKDKFAGQLFYRHLLANHPDKYESDLKDYLKMRYVNSEIELSKSSESHKHPTIYQYMDELDEMDTTLEHLSALKDFYIEKLKFMET